MTDIHQHIRLTAILIVVTTSSPLICRGNESVHDVATNHLGGTDRTFVSYDANGKKSLNVGGGYSLKVETPYLNNTIQDYNVKESVRIDVGVYKDNLIINAYDLKTGGARLTRNRILQIQKHAGNIPVKEIRPQ